jgi:hypothetical protein
MTRKPSCLISCRHTAPDGGLGAFVGKHGGMNPDGKVRGRDNISESYIAERRTQRKARGGLGATPGPSVPVRACEGSKEGRRPSDYQLRPATKSPAEAGLSRSISPSSIDKLSASAGLRKRTVRPSRGSGAPQRSWRRRPASIRAIYQHPLWCHRSHKRAAPHSRQPRWAEVGADNRQQPPPSTGADRLDRSMEQSQRAHQKLSDLQLWWHTRLSSRGTPH